MVGATETTETPEQEQQLEDVREDEDSDDKDDEQPEEQSQTLHHFDADKDESQNEEIQALEREQVEDSNHVENSQDMGTNIANDNSHEDNVVSDMNEQLEDQMSVTQEDMFDGQTRQESNDVSGTNSTEEPDSQIQQETEVLDSEASNEESNPDTNQLGTIHVDDDRGRTVRRSARITQFTQEFDLDEDESIVKARIMSMLNAKTIKFAKDEFAGFNTKFGKAVKAVSFLQTYSLRAGIKRFEQDGEQAAMSEMKQLNDRRAFIPIDPNALSASERKKVLESLIFLVQKKDGRVKARTCANGSVQRGWMDKVDAANPTAMVESIFLTTIVEAKEGRRVITVDIPNAFIQTDVGNDKDGDRIIMKMRGPIVDMLVKLDYELYHDKVMMEGKDKVLYVHVKKAVYGMIDSSILSYTQLRRDLEEYGFEINPYDPCVVNKMVNGKQMTITWHVDDLKASHVDQRVLDEFTSWLDDKYGSKENPVTVHTGNKHRYLGMTIDYSVEGKVRIDMTDYVEDMLEEFPYELNNRITKTPATENIFSIDESPRLDEQRAAILHTYVAKCLFLCKRARPDIQVPVAFLTTRVKEPTEQDWYKLLRMLKFLKSTKHDVLTLSADDLTMMKWFCRRILCGTP